MKSGEVRLGNCVFVRMKGVAADVPHQVVAIYSYKVIVKEVDGNNEFECSMPNLKGIPLTDSFMQKIGMSRHATKNHLILNETLVLGMESKMVTLFAFDEEDAEYIELMEIKYLHQLQNIYFDCTGKELVLN